ncbi:hypothetical protein ACFV0C_10540 [Streptomyces sp. NPDC059568]
MTVICVGEPHEPTDVVAESVVDGRSAVLNVGLGPAASAPASTRT